MKKRYSIRYKFLFVTTTLLFLCVCAFLYIAIDALKVDKEELVFDYKRNLVTNISGEIEQLLNKATDTMRLVAHFYGTKEGSKSKFIENLFERDSDIVALKVSSDYKNFNESIYLNESFLKTYALEQNYFNETLIKEKPFSLDLLLKDGEIIWNATLVDGPPLIGFAKSVVHEDEHSALLNQFIIIVYIRVDRVLKTLNQAKLNEIFVLSKSGQVLIHSNPEVMQKQSDFKNDEIYQRSQSEEIKTTVFKYLKNSMLGAFSKSFKDQVIVISKISEEKAFSAVNRLVFRSLLFALIVFTLAFICAILFSRSLTRPIESLTNGMKKVSDGDLDTQIKIQTKDEIEQLAENFNTMIRDLKQSRESLQEVNRDLEKKVKLRTQQLQEQNEAVKKAQEALLKTTRLAAVGEIAGHTAHEVLNPLTVMLTRLQKLKNKMETQMYVEAEFLKNLITSWEKDYSEGGFKQLIETWDEQSKINPRNTLWEEDLENLKKLTSSLEDENKTISNESDFLIREGMRINKIVQKMRSLSTMKSESRKVVINDLVIESSKIMSDLASQTNVDIAIEQSTIYEVVLDPDEFIQVMVNLIRNSLHAIRSCTQTKVEHKGLIKLSITEQDKKVLIRISDNGNGIEPQYQKKLFESQFSTKPQHEGTGLGLGISRRLIRSFNGDLFLEETSAQKGTTFCIQLPLAVTSNMRESA